MPPRRGRLWFLGISPDYPSTPDHPEPGAYLLEGGRLTRWGRAEGLLNGRVYAFAEGSDGSYWFGTLGGLSRWHQGEWSHWTRYDGLRTNMVFALAAGDETILVCDDEDLVLGAISSLLEIRGYTVLRSKSGRGALEVASSYAGQIALLATDVIMPGMNGPELAKRLTQMRPNMKVMYMSGYPSDVLKASQAEGEDTEFPQKPPMGDALFRCVRKVLDQASSRVPVAVES